MSSLTHLYHDFYMYIFYSIHTNHIDEWLFRLRSTMGELKATNHPCVRLADPKLMGLPLRERKREREKRKNTDRVWDPTDKEHSAGKGFIFSAVGTVSPLTSGEAFRAWVVIGNAKLDDLAVKHMIIYAELGRLVNSVVWPKAQQQPW